MDILSGTSETLWHSDEHEIRQLLMGRRITSVTDNTLTLDNGTTLTVEAANHDGPCCDMHNTLHFLATFDNVITRVQFVTKELADASAENPRSYEIFVYSSKVKTKNKGKTAILSVSGDQGNFGYGSGYTLTVTP